MDVCIPEWLATSRQLWVGTGRVRTVQKITLVGAVRDAFQENEKKKLWVMARTFSLRFRIISYSTVTVRTVCLYLRHMFGIRSFIEDPNNPKIENPIEVLRRCVCNK